MNLRSMRAYCSAPSDDNKPLLMASRAVGVTALILLWPQLNGARWAWYLLADPGIGAWIALSCYALLLIYLAVASLLLRNHPAARRQAMWFSGFSIAFNVSMALLIRGTPGQAPEIFGASTAEQLHNLGILAPWDCVPGLVLLIGVNFSEICPLAPVSIRQYRTWTRRTSLTEA